MEGTCSTDARKSSAQQQWDIVDPVDKEAWEGQGKN
jgi:hypothetical protein